MSTRIRKIGNSLGITITRDQLQKAGFRENDVLQAVAKKGTITLHLQSVVNVSLTLDEARAVSDGDWDSENGRNAQEKIRSTVKNLKENTNEH